MTASAAAGRSGGAITWIGGAVLAVVVVALVVVTSRQEVVVAFDPASSAPDGYRALALLLRDRGAEVDSTAPVHLGTDPVPAGSVMVVPDPDLLTAVEYRAALESAEAGATVVLGAPRRSGSDDPGGSDPDEPDPGVGGGVPAVPARVLADTPAEPTRQGACDIGRLDGLGPIDTAFGTPVTAGDAGAEARGCYGDVRGTHVLEEDHGAGTLITLSSPYLWANARLQPDKEDGGEPLDNAAVALRLLGPTGAGATEGTSVTFVDAVPTAGVAPDGTRNPIELLPTGVKLALVQLVAAFLLYAWWRSRRLGPVVVERMPVEIAGSELVVAVGDLMRRKGSAQRAADVLRADARRDLARGLGVPLDAPAETVVRVVSTRSGRDVDAVAAVLGDGPVPSAEALVRLASSLSDIRQEVLENHVPPR